MKPDALIEILLNSPFRWGLSADEVNLIDEMLLGAAPWPEIAKRLTWDEPTLREYYLRAIERRHSSR